jgi:hypothetical protein
MPPTFIMVPNVRSDKIAKEGIAYWKEGPVSLERKVGNESGRHRQQTCQHEALKKMVAPCSRQ